MPGPKPEYPIELSASELVKVRQLANGHKTAQVKAMRARIILNAHEHPEWSNQKIAQAVSCSDRTVRKWRSRWYECQSLDDLPRAGAPRRFSP